MAKLINQAKNAGMNSDATVLAKMKRLSELKKHPELESIFSIHEDTLAAIVESMKQNGYDVSQPIVLGKINDIVSGDYYIIDGYTRYEAALTVGIDEVPVVEKEFESLEAAKLYCFKRQSERRNLSQAEIYNAAVKLNIPSLKLAKEMGVAVSTITRAKKIEREADPEEIDAIKNNKKTINQVYTRIKNSKPKNQEPEDIDEISGASGTESEYNDMNPEEPEDDPDGGILDNAIAESETDDPDTDILDGAITESETIEKYEDDPVVQTIKNITILLSDNGETSAVTVIHNAYPDIFNEGEIE